MKAQFAIPFAALMGLSAATLVSTQASAAIVCNGEGDCWHTHTAYQYQPEFGVVTHSDDWKWKEGEKHAWREHDGKGYWKGGSWKEF